MSRGRWGPFSKGSPLPVRSRIRPAHGIWRSRWQAGTSSRARISVPSSGAGPASPRSRRDGSHDAIAAGSRVTPPNDGAGPGWSRTDARPCLCRSPRGPGRDLETGLPAPFPLSAPFPWQRTPFLACFGARRSGRDHGRRAFSWTRSRAIDERVGHAPGPGFGSGGRHATPPL